MNRSVFSSKKQNYRTPPEVLAPLEAFAGRIALDPCSGPGSIVRARIEIAPPRDGLEMDWRYKAKGGLIFVNPPYCDVEEWARKTAEEARHGAELALLVPARTAERWWHDSVVPGHDAICFFKGRLRFLGGKHTAPFPSALVCYGDRSKAFWRHFSPLGWVVRR